jgi:hypothetical protein
MPILPVEKEVDSSVNGTFVLDIGFMWRSFVRTLLLDMFDGDEITGMA